MSEQIDAFPQIPSHKKSSRGPSKSALQKVQEKLGPYGYFEEKKSNHYGHSSVMYEVGVADRVFPYKKHPYAKAATVESALKQVPDYK